MDLESLRREYLQGGLSRDELARDPFDQFSLWMQQAIELGVVDPTAMTIATVSADGQPWHAIERQVKVCGEAVKVSTAESLKYFASRPKESQIAAIASQQSRVLTSRSLLLNQFESLKQKFSNGEIPLPDFWGGYRVEPKEIEFWQGGANRLHDRFRYLLQEDTSWSIDRLAP